MKYTREIEIALPRQRVIELFDDPENLKKWMPGLQTFEHLDGDPGQTGARTRMRFDMNGRTIEMVETITSRDLPQNFSATYESSGVYNRVVNRFEEAGTDKTRWIAEHEFRFSGFMRIIGLLMGWAFPRQTMQTMQHFKSFAEGASH